MEAFVGVVTVMMSYGTVGESYIVCGACDYLEYANGAMISVMY
jgi:hypothetical protein